MRKWFDLGTDNKAVARRKLARLAKEHAETSAAPEDSRSVRSTFFKERESEARDIMNDPIRFNKHVASHIGRMIVTAVGSADIRDVLDQAKAQGKSRRMLTHIRRVMNLPRGCSSRLGVVSTPGADPKPA